MQSLFIGAALLVAAALGFWVVMIGGRLALRKWDAHQVISHSRRVEREAKRKEEAMRRYSMTNLRPARKS